MLPVRFAPPAAKYINRYADWFFYVSNATFNAYFENSNSSDVLKRNGKIWHS